ncbi:acyltransferase family protein [Streptomyces syringium]|uniref:acyltransferase family protein n=1 Tax=Streptomyces syringium TaxID=76729 RepID=UPI0034563E67
MSLIPTIITEPSIKPTTVKVRLDSLTGLRWYAALFVACFHFAYEQSSSGTSLYNSRLKEVVYAGPSAVSFFFVLSGFVLAWSARPHDTLAGFWRRRFARIYPSHLATFCLAVVTMAWMGKALNPVIALGNLSLLQSWVPSRSDWWFGYNGVSWSLSCELLFYLTFPFAVRLLLRLSTRGLWTALALANLCVGLAPLCTRYIGRVTGWDAQFMLYIFPPTRLLEFVIGITVALLVKNRAWRGPGLVTSLALSVLVAFGPIHIMPYNFSWSADTVIPYTLTIAAAARADIQGEPSPFRNRVNLYLGEVSFAFYLVHEIVIYSADHFLRARHLALPLTIYLALVIAASLVGAVLLHEYVEKPGVRLLSGGRRKRRAGTV